MEENIYMYADGDIYRRIGSKIRELRLRQNITQQSLAHDAQISLSSVKKIEAGEIGTFDTLLRVMRILGVLDIFSPMMREEEMSPNEYYEFVHKLNKKRRRRASPSKPSYSPSPFDTSDSEW